MEGDAGAAPEKSRKWFFVAAGAGVVLILVLVAFASVSGIAGHSCNCGPFPRISATTEGDAIIVTYTGVWSDREGVWFTKRLPDEENFLTTFHYRVKSSDGTDVQQDYPAPGSGKDQTVRFEHAATAGKDQVIVFVNSSDGTTTVVYDMYI
jgi:hypothetical protein